MESRKTPPYTASDSDYVVAGAQQPENGIDARHAGGENVGAVTVFEFGHGALQRFAIGMIGARVIVALVLAELFVHVGGGLVDRCDDGAGGRIRLLPDVNGICSETHE